MLPPAQYLMFEFLPVAPFFAMQKTTSSCYCRTIELSWDAMQLMPLGTCLN